ncbi:MAG TPA: hypothetical protein PK784_09755 [Tenuifilaceae bacterium]|nr:hypothetical protein [Tenuifilaceae bacterium]
MQTRRDLNVLGAFYIGLYSSFVDNIVVWIPLEKILFSGCMAKSTNSTNLGNTVDGDLKAYSITIQ